MELTHIDKNGQASMVDVTDKSVSKREAAACGTIRLNPDILFLLQSNPKGDVLAAARIAGIMAAKNTWNAIPLCHQIPLESVKVEFRLDIESCLLHALAWVRCSYKTGVEMEALHAVSTALLTVYDMCKAAGKNMVIENIHLVSKSGGKSGEFVWTEKL